MTTNEGSISEDLMNRSLPIHLAPVGDLAARSSPIGNPKHEFLPANRDRIEAEIRGMVENWKWQDMPLDCNVRHSCSEWARVVGGILQVNGFADFLGNYGIRRTCDDPVRRALGLLGAEMPDTWLTATSWSPLVGDHGVTEALIPKGERESEKSRSRSLGSLFSKHIDETFVVEADDMTVTLVLERAKRRFEGGEPGRRYRFAVLSRIAKSEQTTEKS